MTFGVKNRLIFFAVLSICGMLTVGLSGYIGQNRQAEALADINIKLRVMRNHLEADMVHDALRADVLAALYAGVTGKSEEAAAIKAGQVEHFATFQANLKDSAALPLPAEIKAALDNITPTVTAYGHLAAKMVDLSFTNNAQAATHLAKFSATFGALEDEMAALSDLIEKHAERSQKNAKALAAGGLSTLVAIISAVGFICVGFSIWSIKTVISPLRQLHLAINRLRSHDGNLERLAGFTAEFAEIQAAFNGVLDDLEEKQRSEQEKADGAFRVQQALNVTTTNIVLADAGHQIIYVNDTAQQLFQLHGHALARDLPNMRPGSLVGSNVATLYREGSAMLATFNQLRASRHDEYSLGERRFNIHATPVLNLAGERLGTVFEWEDLTDQHNTAAQIQGVLAAAIEGNLDRRLEVQKMSGFMRTMGEGVNQMLDAIVGPVLETTEVMTKIAEGDLTKRMDGTYRGKFARLRDAVNNSTSNLLDMVEQIRDAAGSIGTASGEISKGNQDLNQRTTEQATALEETSSSLRNITETVKQNTQNARQANQLAATARSEAEKGGSVVSSAISAMVEINSASRKIADIISVIDGIAFQTNLLALNAAVEAARAGEQGRGFAVVAAEVRNLAQRSAGAAKEIKTLINDSVSRVDEGTRLVNESGATLQTIVGSVKKVSDIIAEIAAASEEQSSGIEGLNRAVTSMDETTQQNAALVEEAAAASESMDSQAQTLTRLMAFFQVGGSTASYLAAAPERRSSARPWTKPKPPAVTAFSALPAAAGDEAWEEF